MLLFIVSLQFILTIRKDGQTLYQKVLSASDSCPSAGLSSWSWGFPTKHAHYTGLYPRSWTVYEIPQHKLVLICQQVRSTVYSIVRFQLESPIMT